MTAAFLAGPAICLLAGCGGNGPAKQAPATPVAAVTVGAMQEPGGGEGASFSATLHRDREAVLSFRIGGTVRAMPVRAGQRLPAGSPVAALDATPFDAAAARQSAEVARLGRTASRYEALVPEGAVAEAQAKDARDALAAARAGLTAARYDAASARLAMPFPGIVLSRQAEIGETVAPGQPVATVADLRAPLIATAQVPAALAARLRPGMPAQLAVAGQPGAIGAHVLRIAGASDARSGTVAVDLALAGAPALASGTVGSVRFALPPDDATSAPEGVLIPAEALLEGQGERAFVYVIDSAGKARRRRVRLLGFADQSARVSGLPGGARVITAGAGFVSEGEAVTVTAQ